jgi:hypothetical protein
MPKITILCPYHKVSEELELPESYAEGTFQGEVPCGHPEGPDYRAILNIEIIQSKVRRIGLKESPPSAFKAPSLKEVLDDFRLR